MGTSSSMASVISWTTRASTRVAARLRGASRSSSSWIWRSMRDSKASSRRRRSMRIMANLIRSAAVPCMGRVDGHVHRLGAHARIAAVQLRQVAPASEQRHDVPRLPSLLDRAIQEGPHTGVGVEVLLDEGPRLVQAHVGLARQALRPHAVDDAEVDGLGTTAEHRRDALGGDLEDPRGGGPVDVLRPPGRPRGAPRRRTGGPAAAARSGCSRPRGTASRPRARTPCGSPGPSRSGSGCSAGWGRWTTGDPWPSPVWWKEVWTRPVSRIDGRGKRIHVGALQLGERSVLEHHRRKLMVRGEFQQRALVRRVPRALGRLLGAPSPEGLVELQVSKRSLPRCAVERMLNSSPGKRVDPLLHLVRPPAQIRGDVREELRVEPDAAVLHAREDRDERHLHLAEDVLHLPLDELGLDVLPQAHRDVGVLAGVGGHVGNRHLGHRDLVLALADQVRCRHLPDPEPTHRHLVEVVGAAARIDAPSRRPSCRRRRPGPRRRAARARAGRT